MAQRGRLKIFFGYGGGDGTLRAMLAAARAEKRRGRDAVVGCVDDGDWQRVRRSGLPVLPSRGSGPRELNLNAALARRPQLILLGNLAHANPPGCRHERRDQDAQELLRAGIDVYAALNVEQLEGMRDAVLRLTGHAPEILVPDAVFDAADWVEFVDAQPSDCADWTAPQLSALRELALRRCADRIGLTGASAPSVPGAPAAAREHILVCLSPAPSNAKVIRMAARMAGAYRCACTAVYVRGSGTLSADDRGRLSANMKLAAQLGAKVETVAGEDVALQIAEYARASGVTQIVLGRSVVARGRLLRKPSIADRLIRCVPGIEIHILPDGDALPRLRDAARRVPLPRVTVSDFVKSVAIQAMATALSVAFYQMGFSDANIIMAYILGVLLTAVSTSNMLCSSASSIASVFIFNYLFTEPRFTLQAYDAGYPATFLIMFLAAIMTGTLASRLKEHARESARAAYRTRVLLETNQQLSQAADADAILSAAAGQLIKLFRRDVVVYPVRDGALGPGRSFPARDDSPPADLSDERRVAEWALHNNRQAGATTDTFGASKGLYLTVRIGDSVYAVVGLALGGQALEMDEHSMLLAVLGECALAMENERNVREKEAAAMQARSEQLRADLLRAISHDLRTPLTSISGNASNLLSNGAALDEDTRRQIYADIHDDALWLINLVENLLYVTRIEDGRMKLNCSVELIDEVLQEALRHERCTDTGHRIELVPTDELLFARIDARLIIQVVINLVDNAVKYTPPGSRISLSARREGAWICVRCADDGPGVPDEDKARVFEMFYSGRNRCADSRRSLGLGLGLCKSIVSAHGGAISVEDNQPHGAVFRFTVPAEEVHLNEQAADPRG